jgi:hypothetical protein
MAERSVTTSSVTFNVVPSLPAYLSCVCMEANFPVREEDFPMPSSAPVDRRLLNIGNTFLGQVERNNGDGTDITIDGLLEGSAYEVTCKLVADIDLDYPDAIKRFPTFYVMSTAGFTQHVTISETKATSVKVIGMTAKNTDVTCVAVADGRVPAYVTSTPTAAGTAFPTAAPTTTEDGDSIPQYCAAVAAEQPFWPDETAAGFSATVATSGQVPFEITITDLQFLTDYTVTCCTTEDDFAFSFTNMRTKKSSGIVGDPHVLGGDGSVADFFGQAGNSYNLYTSTTMNVIGRLGAALTASSQETLYHPSAMERGTLLTEVAISCGGSQLRVALHAGGLVSVVTPGLATKFLTSGRDAEFELSSAVKVSWAQVEETRRFHWGAHRYSQQLQLTSASTDETVAVFVAESQGHRFIDVEATVGRDTQATGLLNVASASPAAFPAMPAAQFLAASNPEAVSA